MERPWRPTNGRCVVFLGLRTVIYPTTDLDAAKAWFAGVLGIEPYFDQPFYVGFEVGGYELGLLPDAPGGAGPVTYWGVANADLAFAHLVESGATANEPVNEVGDGIRVASVVTPSGSVLGIIENPHFSLSVRHAADDPATGPGR